MSVEQVVLYLFFGFFVVFMAGVALSARRGGDDRGAISSDEAANALEARALGFGVDVGDGAGRS